MPQGREYELKFSFAPEDTERLMAHPSLQAARGDRRAKRLVSAYFDTPDALLRRKRVSLRVRQSDGGTTQTLKGPGSSLVDRSEWEHAGSGTRPDPAWLRSTPLKSLFKDEEIVGSLEPRFTVEVSRTICPIAFDGATIEGALDQGVIRARNLSLPVNEFELELVAGADASVMAFARALAADVPLVLSLVTKAERGYGVADLTWGQPTKELPLDLSEVRTIADGFATVTQACLHAICRNAALIGNAADDIEAVHKTRIALRHLRAAFGLFEPVLRRRGSKVLRRELKWISDKLGDTRDADVFQQGTFDKAAEANEPPGAAAVAEIMRSRQRQTHRRLRKALASPRWRLLLLDLLAFSGDGVRRGKRKSRCAPFVRGQLAAHHRDLARGTRHWSRRTDEHLHDVRKRAKMLRYDLDLLGDLPKLGIGRRTLKKLGEDLQAMQQTLGEAHDRIAMREHLGDVILRRSAPPGTADAAWDGIQTTARDLAGAAPQDNAALDDARKAAKRLRRRTF